MTNLSDDLILETHLYIGVNPRSRKDEDVIASFTGFDMVPLGWYFLFTPESIAERGEEFPGQLEKFDKSDSLDSLEQYIEEPVAMKISLPDAKSRLKEFREAFKSIPYIWSYFKIIDILDKELEKYIEQLEEEPSPQIVPVRGPHPETKLSQVEIQGDNKQPSDTIDSDNPFAALADLGASADPFVDKERGEMEEKAFEGFSDNDLLVALEEAAALDFEAEEDLEEEQARDEHGEWEDDGIFMPVVIYFDQVASDGRGKRMGRIPLLLERLMHHAIREGEMTRVMQDLLQEIFREALSGWRITGQLAEDFVQGNPDQLADIMLGEPSPYVIIDEALDLEYWTQGTLQSGDERLMYSLTLLPSEEIHIAIKAGRLEEISDKVGQLLVTTQGVSYPRLTVEELKRPPLESNIWGFRVFIRDLSGQFKAATLLISDPAKSWEMEFEDRINLPGVLEDWNVDFPVRFEEFSDIDHYQIVFEGARDLEETFKGFVRWARRHHIMYQQQFGVKGTILRLKKMLEETQDKQFGQLLFDILTNLTELGFNTAIDALSDDVIVRKLPWLYS